VVMPISDGNGAFVSAVPVKGSIYSRCGAVTVS
jgi:hypothetical protein